MSGGAWLAAASSAACLLLLPLRRRLPAPVVAGALALAGAALAAGGMMIRPDPSTAEAVASVVLAAVLVPAHVRIVLGPLGPPRR